MSKRIYSLEEAVEKVMLHSDSNSKPEIDEDLIVPNFSQYFKPGKEISLDEMTAAFKGRNIIKQYDKSKPDKWE